MNSDRFRFFSSVLQESDLLVGLNHSSYFKGIESICRDEQARLYNLLSDHIAAFPSFATSLTPLDRPVTQNLSPELNCMYNAGFATRTGPMSSVAGIFAEYVGKAIVKGLEQTKLTENSDSAEYKDGSPDKDRNTEINASAEFSDDFPDKGRNTNIITSAEFTDDAPDKDRNTEINASAEFIDDAPDKDRNTNIISSAEVMVENGGDLYVKNREELVVVVHAGKVALSGKLGLVLPPGEWGVCTSSGTQGHSFSRGKADAVTVVAGSTPLADAWATALANEVEGRLDIEPLLERVADIPEILACVVIAGGELGIRGAFETKLLT